MANISVSGIGSGLDVNSLVTQLISAERSGADKRLANNESKANVKLSAIGTYRSALSALRDAANDLKVNGIFKTLSAQSSDTSLFTASASGAVPGSYNVEVAELARANKLATSGFGSGTTVVGAGSATLTVNGQSFTVNLSSGTSTVADLRDAINGASDNKGATATLVTDQTGTHLVLSAKQTGVANAVSISTSLASFTETQEARNAHILVDGYDAYSAVNTVSGVIDGVTLNLVKAAPGTTATLTVGSDSKAASDAIQKFVTAYNNLITSTANLTKYNAATKTASALTGDPAVRDASRQLRSILGGTVSGAGSYDQLWQIGITTNTDGSLKVDKSKLDAALSGNYSSVQNLFSAAGGFATSLDAKLDSYLDTDGRVDALTHTVQAQLDRISDDKDALERRMTLTEQRYRAQFTALDTLITQLKGTSDFLTNQLSSLNKSS